MHNKYLLKIAIAAAILPFTLAGCATFHQAHQMQSSTESTVSHAHVPRGPAIVTTVTTPYLLGDEVQVVHRYPSLLNAPVQINSGRPVSLQEAVSLIVQHTNIPFSVDISAPTQKAGATLPPLPGGSGSVSMDNGSTHRKVTVQWNGSVHGLLDFLAAHFSCWWKYEDGTVIFYNQETRTFNIPAFAVHTVASNSIMAGSMGSSGGSSGGGGASSSGGSSGGGGGGSSSSSGMVSIDNTTTVNVWSSLQKEAEIAGNGATVYANASLGTLTVSGTPPQIGGVSRWVKRLTHQMGRQVAIVVHVYTIQLSNGQSYGFQPKLVFNAANGVSSAAYQSVTPPQSSSGTPASLSAGILTGPFAGSGVTVSALASMGKVVGDYTYPSVTLNGEPVAIQDANKEGYLASTSPTIVSNGVTSGGGLQPSSVTTGFTGLITPRVVGDDIYLNVNLNISELLSLQQFTSGGQTIYAPQTTQLSIPQMVKLKSGNTLVLSELIQDNATVNHSGVGAAEFPLLGGGGAASTKRNLVVVTVNARIL